jgi:hypothetical protein
MSGTLGIAPIRTAGVEGVHRLVHSLRVRRTAVARRGGLATPVAVVVAIVVTVTVVWATVTVASGWGPV